MAVVQISRIQVRRGKKGVDNLPQLASGELGWAIDTQEFYIGNGSVSEGAPAVGNTKILTEHDNIIDLAGTYTYKSGSGAMQTGVSATQPVKRSLQQRLDDVVNGKNFDIKGDGVTDDTIAFQRAVDQLYLNTNKGNASSRVTLQLDAGTYVLSGTIKLPPYTCIVGAGQDKTIIQTSASEGFTFVNGDSSIGSYSAISNNSFLNQAKYITLEGMSFTQSVQGTMFDAHSVRDSIFRNLKLTGDWTAGGAIASTSRGFSFVGDSAAVMSNNNTLDNVEIRQYSYGIYSDYDIKSNLVKDSKFDTCGYGIVLGENLVQGQLGQDKGPSYFRIQNTIFDEIARNAIWAKVGTEINSVNNLFYSVGNNNGTEAQSAYAVIKYDKKGNTSESDYFQRFELLGYDQQYILNQKFTPIIEGFCVADLNQNDTLEVTTETAAQRYFRLPGDANTNYEIDYVYHSNNFQAHRSGTLTIACDVDNENIIVKDTFDFAGTQSLTTNFKFGANLVDENADANKETIEVNITNTTLTDSGTLTFKVKSKR